MKLFTWQDIGLDKAYTIGRRGEWRDYVDLYFVINQGFALKNIVRKARKKFSDSFSEKLFLSQLVYFKDLKDLTIDIIGKKYSEKEIKEFLKQAVKKYQEKRIKGK